MRRVLVPHLISPVLPPAGSVAHALAGATMGTSWSARMMLPPNGPQPERLAERLREQLDIVVAQMSHWEPDSNLGRYNRARAGSWHQLPEPFYQVMRYALEVADACGGAYDPCAGALVNAWGFGALGRYDQPEFQPPSSAAIAAIQAAEARRHVQFDALGRRLLQPGGVQLDLSSVAKGYAVDLLARCLDAAGVHHYLVEVGGELRGAGVKADGQPWWVELEGVPGADASADDAAPLVALHGLAVATSGDYRRFFQHHAQRASHTLDPRSGYPIRHGVASVTVLHTSCMAADALSTALTVLGPQDGMDYANRHGLAARFLLRTGRGFEERLSPAFQDMLQ